jgi:hypothetical protein
MGIGIAASVITSRAPAVTRGGQGIVILAHIIRDFIATVEMRLSVVKEEKKVPPCEFCRSARP